MIILSHRGYWKDVSEKNKSVAFRRSFELGFGTETDLRDHNEQIVIAHDMPNGSEMTFEELLLIMDGRNLPLALNVKADGLFVKIKELLEKYHHTNYFVFDMSIPDMVAQLKFGMRVFTGLSDILKTPVLIEQSAGIWLDSFLSDWYDSAYIDNLLNNIRKKICIVSADLHKRQYDKQWDIIKKTQSYGSDSLMLCTDFPEDARKFFYDM